MKTKSGVTAKTTPRVNLLSQLRLRHRPKRPLQARQPQNRRRSSLSRFASSRALIGEAHGISKKQANEVLAGTIALIGEHLKKGARIRIAGLGTLEVRKRSARMGRNPATGEAIEIKASKKVAFRAAKDLSEAI